MDFASNLEALIKESGLPYRSSPRSWTLACPKCSKSKLAFLKRKPKFRCWVCAETHGFRGLPEYGLTEILQLSLDEIRQKLYGTDVQHTSLLDLHWGEDDIEEEDEGVETTLFFWPHNFHPIDHPFSERGAEYLAGRGIPLDIAKQYGVRYCPGKQSVAFPVQSGPYLLGWQERVIIPTKYYVDGETIEIPKNHNPAGMSKTAMIMFANRITSDHALLAEGPISSIKGHLCGGNIATIGKAVDPMQIQLLKNAGVRKLYIGLDPDAAAEINRLIRDQRYDFQLYDMVPETGDLGDMSFEEVYEMFKRAQPIEWHRRFFHLK